MAPENADAKPETGKEESAPKESLRPGRFRPRGLIILLTVTALVLSRAALAIVFTNASSTRDEVLEHLPEAGPEPVVEKPEPLRPGGGRVNHLVAIAEQLEQSGEMESARRVRAAAQRILIARSEEDGAFDFACRLLENGNPKESRRALYRILARADQPGTHWGELATRARFLIGRTLAMEADGREIEQEGNR